MTNDRIQKWLAAVARHEANRALLDELPGPLVVEAAEIIRALAGPDGAIGIADAAARDVICGECSCYEDSGLHYWEISPKQSAMVLDSLEDGIAQAITRAVHYLTARGLLQAHPTNARYVRPLVEI